MSPKQRFTACIAGASGLAALAQSTPPATPVPNPPSAGAGVINDYLRHEAPSLKVLDLGVQGRARYEYREYFAVPGAGPTAVDFRATTPVEVNDYLLLRSRFHVGYTPCDWFTVYGEGQNSSSTGDIRNPNLQSDGPVNLYQGYVRVGAPKEFPVSLKVGRQELAYGDERLVGTFAWDNIGRVFDAAKLRFENETLWVDAFVSQVVVPVDNGWNASYGGTMFSGLYASTRQLVPKVETQLYFLADNVSDDADYPTGALIRPLSRRDVYTLGTRLKSLPGQFGAFDFEGEFAGQFGTFSYLPGTTGVDAGRELDQRSFALHLTGGYTFKETPGTPRLAVEYNFGSGDDNPTDDRHGTFVNLFPTNHKFYGFMDFWCWQNLQNPSLVLTFTPARRLSVKLNYNAFWLATTSDFFYQVNQAPRVSGGYGLRPDNGNFGGQEIDLVATWSPLTWATLEAGYGHYFTGTYIDETLASVGGAHDANWAYVQATLNF